MSKSYQILYLNNEPIGTYGNLINPVCINSNRKKVRFPHLGFCVDLLIIVLCIRVALFG